MLKNVMKNDVTTAFWQPYQNLNSGSLLANGLNIDSYSPIEFNSYVSYLNSSLLDVGSPPSSESASSGSNCGERKPMSWLSR